MYVTLISHLKRTDALEEETGWLGHVEADCPVIQLTLNGYRRYFSVLIFCKT